LQKATKTAENRICDAFSASMGHRKQQKHEKSRIVMLSGARSKEIGREAHETP
jgi:hypothetical protein